MRLVLVLAIAAMILNPATALGFASGTGTAINGNYLVTANHVVENFPYSCLYIPYTGKCHKLDIVAQYPDVDLAIVRLHPKKDGITLSSCEILDNEVVFGTEVTTYGYPGSLDSSDKKVKRKTSFVIDPVYWNEDHNLYRINTELMPGYSGGPSLDRYGRIVGISRSVYPESGVSNIIKSSIVSLVLWENDIQPVASTVSGRMCSYIIINSKEEHFSLSV